MQNTDLVRGSSSAEQGAHNAMVEGSIPSPATNWKDPWPKTGGGRMWFKVRAVLTVLTNILVKGRQMGFWTKKDGIPK